ncbi:hypothetical protein WN48_00011 [Eufriesea mexicana]|uniref:Uncharacterized protein n=1 Tax=Eufriesea mexicana TaxID=516756 RepID=A0A310SD77_9HYME|nr:hypothetical protein WN48_00011 [Eufriesea mexicana]
MRDKGFLWREWQGLCYPLIVVSAFLPTGSSVSCHYSVLLTVIDPEERILLSGIDGGIFKPCQCDRTIESWLTRHFHDPKNSSKSLTLLLRKNRIYVILMQYYKGYVDTFLQVSVTHAVKK